MIEFLRKLFIKDYSHTEINSVREAHGVFCAVFGIVSNLILVALKIGAAIILASSNSWIFSMALIGDALNNFSDMSSCIVTLVGFKLSNKPADKNHPFGHQRIEYIAGLIVSVVVIFAGLELAVQSIEKIINGSIGSFSWLTVIILAISVTIKLFQGYINYSFGKVISSPTLKSTAIDSLTDAVATFLISVSAVLTILFHWSFLDNYLGVAISVFVIYSGISMLKETANPLIGEAENKDFVMKIERCISKHPEVLGIHDTLVHKYGPTNAFVSLHVEIDERMSLRAAHELIDGIEREVAQEFKCVLTIHADPVTVGDPRTAKVRESIDRALSSFDAGLSIHDLRVFIEGDNEVIACDILMPFSKKELSQEIILNAISLELAQEEKQPLLRITFDRPYHE